MGVELLQHVVYIEGEALGDFVGGVFDGQVGDDSVVGV